MLKSLNLSDGFPRRFEIHQDVYKQSQYFHKRLLLPSGCLGALQLLNLSGENVKLFSNHQYFYKQFQDGDKLPVQLLQQ